MLSWRGGWPRRSSARSATPPCPPPACWSCTCLSCTTRSSLPRRRGACRQGPAFVGQPTRCPCHCWRVVRQPIPLSAAAGRAPQPTHTSWLLLHVRLCTGGGPSTMTFFMAPLLDSTPPGVATTSRPLPPAPRPTHPTHPSPELPSPTPPHPPCRSSSAWWRAAPASSAPWRSGSST